jgi:uncharacterized protein involved in response to NO
MRALSLEGEDPRQLAVAPRLALARKGFRPFFLLAAGHACAIVPLWILVLTGAVRPGAYLDPTSWHVHEMVFGFAAAVVAGFLLTAVGNWTKRETLVGAPLLGLSALWLAGRTAMVAPGLFPRGVTAAVDLAFLPVLGAVLGRPLVTAGNRRNLVMLAPLGGLFAANVVMHAGALGLIARGDASRAHLVAVDLVIVLVVILSGRVFPMFTRNATGATDVRSHPALDRIAVASTGALAIADAIDPHGRAAATFAALAAVFAAARAARWGTRHTLRVPLLWILHLGYAWVPAGLLLRALAAVVPQIPPSLGTHALTVGAIGSLTLGMMARVSLGHTGRPLVAPRAAVWGFRTITAAAIVRVFLQLLAPAAYLTSLVVAAVLWTVAFLTYLLSYAPILAAPRVDGRPG